MRNPESGIRNAEHRPEPLMNLSSLNRREFLSWPVCGLGGAAFLSLLYRDGRLQAAPVSGEAPDPPPHHTPKARRAIHIYLSGGFSQGGCFDYKTQLGRL